MFTTGEPFLVGSVDCERGRERGTGYEMVWENDEMMSDTPVSAQRISFDKAMMTMKSIGLDQHRTCRETAEGGLTAVRSVSAWLLGS